MNELKQRLEQEPAGEPAHGAVGRETDWMRFTELELSEGKLLICDLGFIPSEDEGLLVQLPAGSYEVQAKLMEYPGDRRVSRLRAAPAGIAAVLGEPLGETWTDTAQTSLCDFTALTRHFESAAMDEDTLQETIEQAQDEQGSCGVLELDAARGAVAPFVDSGFGDGTFPVFALTADGRRVGVEIEFIAAGEPYPFGSREPGREPRVLDTTDDETWSALRDMLAQVRARSSGDKEKDREALKSLAAEFLGGLENKVKAAVEAFRQHLIELRKRPLPLSITLQPDEPANWSGQPAAQERIQALRRAGFVPAGCFQVPQLPGYLVCGWVHPTEHVRALVEETDGRIFLVVSAHLEDGREFSVVDFPARPGLTRPPWVMVEEHGGAAPEALIATFFQRRPAVPPLPQRPEDFPLLFERSFRRVQAWRAERGGWTLAEIKLQRGLPETAETTEELLMERHDSAELWLFNWLRLQSGLPFDPGAVLERLVIIHDDLTPDLLLNQWLVATMDLKAKEGMFAGSSPREAFARVNEERGPKLRRVLQKNTGFPADYYLPADTPVSPLGDPPPDPLPRKALEPASHPARGPAGPEPRQTSEASDGGGGEQRR